MRVGLMTREYPPEVYGGAGVHVEYLSRELAKLIEVEVHCWGTKQEDAGNLHVRGDVPPPEVTGDTQAKFKAAVDASGQASDAWMTLASYYARRKQWDQMLKSLHAGIDADAKAAKPHGPALVEGAGVLSHSRQDPQLAIQLLDLYLASPNQSADAPAFQVHARLSRILEQQGDHAGAQQHIEAAALLAHDYHPVAPRAD